MDFQSAMETFAEAWMAANTKSRPGSSDHQVRGERCCGEGVIGDQVNSGVGDTCWWWLVWRLGGNSDDGTASLWAW